MADQTKAAMGADSLEVLADRGYFSSEQILACETLGVTPYVPKPMTSSAKAEGRFGKEDFEGDRFVRLRTLKHRFHLLSRQGPRQP
jgi:hypothetical protein